MTQQYRTHHAQIIDMIDLLDGRLDAEELGTDPTPTRRLFTQLAGKLLFHLAIEDGALYPRLLGHGQREIRQLAGQYVAESGQLRIRFEDFMRRWVHSDLIRQEPEAFIGEARSIFRALRARIDKEDNGLYELVDRFEGHTAAMLFGVAV